MIQNSINQILGTAANTLMDVRRAKYYDKNEKIRQEEHASRLARNEATAKRELSTAKLNEAKEAQVRVATEIEGSPEFQQEQLATMKAKNKLTRAKASYTNAEAKQIRAALKPVKPEDALQIARDAAEPLVTQKRNRPELEALLKHPDLMNSTNIANAVYTQLSGQFSDLDDDQKKRLREYVDKGVKGGKNE